jgi:hypothetical protein
MTDPKKNTGTSEVFDNVFSGPTGAQSGNSNTQVNHYAAPSTPPGGAGRGARVGMVTIAVLLVAGAAGLVAIKLPPEGGGHDQPGRAGTSSASPTSEPPSELVTPPPSPPLSASPSFDPKPGSITPAGQELCIDVEGNRDADDAPVQMWDCNDAEGQRWRLKGDTLLAFSRCLDVYEERTESKTPVILYHCTGGEGQRWEWTSTSKLRNPLSMRCLGYPAGVPGKDVQLAIYDCDTEAARVWTYHY